MLFNFTELQHSTFSNCMQA